MLSRRCFLALAIFCNLTRPILKTLFSARILKPLLLLLYLLMPASGSLNAKEIKLPVLGDAASGIISKQQEYELGRIWLKVFRSRV